MPVFRLRRAVVSMLLTAFLLGFSLDAAAQTGEKCVEERTVAENRYLEGSFDEAVTLLQQCLDREELSVAEAVQVFRLMGLAYMNKGDQEQARQAIRNLLLSAPAYQADPVQDPPSYTTLVNDVRQALEAQALPEVTPETPVDEEEAPVDEEETPVDEEETPVPQEDEEDVPVSQEEPQADQPQEAFPVQPPPDEQVAPPLVTRPQTTQRRVLRTPRSWLLATGGAIVLGAAAALLFGSSSESSPGPPR